MTTGASAHRNFGTKTTIIATTGQTSFKANFRVKESTLVFKEGTLLVLDVDYTITGFYTVSIPSATETNIIQIINN